MVVVDIQLHSIFSSIELTKFLKTYRKYIILPSKINGGKLVYIGLLRVQQTIIVFLSVPIMDC